MRLRELLGFKSRLKAEEVLDTAWKQVQAGKSIESVVAAYPEIAAELEPMLRAMSRTRAAASAPALSPEALVRIEARAQMAARQREQKKRSGGPALVVAPARDAGSTTDRARLSRAPFGARWQAGLVMALVLLIVLGGLATVLERSKIPTTGIVPATATTQEVHVPSVVTREPEITPWGMETVTAVPSIMAATATTGLIEPTAIVSATEQVMLPAGTPTPVVTRAPESSVTSTVAPRPTQTSAPLATATAQLPSTATPTETPIPVLATSTMVPTVEQPTPVPTNTRHPVATPEASQTPVPTMTTVPSPSPSPTQRILPTETSEPTETTEPTETPVPTRTTRPTQTGVPTQTSVPTQTAVPTRTGVVTQTAVPTQTSAPTQTAVPTQTALATQTSDPTETSEPHGTSEPEGTAER